MKSKRKTATISGTVPRIINGRDIATVGRVVNYNADALEELIKRVERLEKGEGEKE